MREVETISAAKDRQCSPRPAAIRRFILKCPAAYGPTRLPAMLPNPITVMKTPYCSLLPERQVLIYMTKSESCNARKRRQKNAMAESSPKARFSTMKVKTLLALSR